MSVSQPAKDFQLAVCEGLNGVTRTFQQEEDARSTASVLIAAAVSIIAGPYYHRTPPVDPTNMAEVERVFASLTVAGHNAIVDAIENYRHRN